MRINAKMFGFIPAPILYGSRLAGAGQARDPRRADRPRHSARRVPVRQLADALRQPRSRQGAQGLGHRGAAARVLRREAVGLLGAQSRPGSLHRPLARRTRQDKVVVVTGSSSGIGKATATGARRRRREGHPRRARRREAPRDQGGDRARGRQGAGSTRRTSPTSRRATRSCARVYKEHGALRLISSTTPAARSGAA